MCTCQSPGARSAAGMRSPAAQAVVEAEACPRPLARRVVCPRVATSVQVPESSTVPLTTPLALRPSDVAYPHEASVTSTSATPEPAGAVGRGGSVAVAVGAGFDECGPADAEEREEAPPGVVWAD